MRKDVQQESPRTHPRESSFVSLMSGWAEQGVQSYFATQRILVDLAMRQSSSVMSGLKEGVSDSRHSPGVLLTEFIDGSINNFVHAQETLLDLVGRQNDFVMTGVQQGIGETSGVVVMTELLRRRIDITIKMQREFVKMAVKQTHAWMAGTKAGKVLEITPMFDLVSQAMGNFVHAEKQFLDAVGEETRKATGSRHRKGAGRKNANADLAGLGRQATESFSEAQKAMVDIAGRQVDMNLKTAGRALDILGPLPLLPISDWTREGMKKLGVAQKAVMDAVTRSRNGSKASPAARRSAKPRRTAKSKIVH